MAFKMKSGSPMKRNFGVGESPAKQKSPMKDKLPSGAGWSEETVRAHNKDNANNPDHKENMHGEGRNTSIAEEEGSVAKMKSPMKHYTGNHEGAKKHPAHKISDYAKKIYTAPYDLLTETIKEGKKALTGKSSNNPLEMKSPMKNSGEEFAREIKETDYQGNMSPESFKRVKDQHDKGHKEGNPHA